MNTEHRVFGPPGTGKTTYLSRQCKRAAGKVGGGSVAICSLTKAAAQEIGGRDTGIPKQNIGTLHAHAFRALNKPEIMETARWLKEWNEWVGTASMRISNKYAVDPENANNEPAALDTEGEEALNQMNVLRSRLVPRELWPPSISRFAIKWEEFKDKSGVMDFTDLIDRATEEIDALPSNPSILMVDEGQDFSKLEMNFVRKMGSAAEQLVIVGDPDQNLYQWRGSDPDAFVAGEAATTITLEQSYRVPAAVHAEAVAWIEQVPTRVPTVYKPRPAEGRTRHEGFQYINPGRMVKDAQAQVANGRSAMILATCGFHLYPTISCLKDHGTLYHNPYRPGHGGWNPKKGTRRLLSFMKAAAVKDGGEGKLWSWNDVKAWTDPLQASKVLQRGAKTLIAGKCQTSRFKEDLGELEVTIEALQELFTEEALGHVLDVDYEWWAKHLLHSKAKSMAYGMTILRRSGAQALRDDPNIIIGTIHSVKGGEADVVYILPDLSNAGFWGGWTQQGASRDAIVRQFYVAMTRAREELVLCGASSQMKVKWL